MNVTQFVVRKSRFCCTAKLVEGTSQERTALLEADGRMLKVDVGVIWHVQMPGDPYLSANSRHPSAEEAIQEYATATVTGALLETQVVPESPEV